VNGTRGGGAGWRTVLSASYGHAGDLYRVMPMYVVASAETSRRFK
jgi:hypothetical protein